MHRSGGDLAGGFGRESLIGGHAVPEGAVDHFDDLGGDVACFCFFCTTGEDRLEVVDAALQVLVVELLRELGVEQSGGEEAAEDDAAGAGEAAIGGDEEFFDVGRQVAGDADLYHGAGVLREGFEDDGGFRGPPAIDGLLADACFGGDSFDRELGVADALGKPQRGREYGFLRGDAARAAGANLITRRCVLFLHGVHCTISAEICTRISPHLSPTPYRFPPCPGPPGMNLSAVFPLTVLVSAQYAGELLARACGLPVPGTVIGGVGLFVALCLIPGLHARIAPFAHTLLRNMLLFFVPASVGVMAIFGDLASHGPLLLAVLVITTWATALAAAFTFDALGGRRKDGAS